MDQLVNEAAEILGIDAAPRPQAEAALRRPAAARGRRAGHRAQAVGLPLRRAALQPRRQAARPDARRDHASSSTACRRRPIYVTHDQVEAMTMGHRIAVMKDGKLQQVGTPLEVYEQPANLFVAAFIGTPPMNFVKATLADGGTTLKTATFSLPVAAGAPGPDRREGREGAHRRDPPREPERRQPPRPRRDRPDSRDRRDRRAARPRGARPRPGRRRRPDRRQGRPAPRPGDRPDDRARRRARVPPPLRRRDGTPPDGLKRTGGTRNEDLPPRAPAPRRRPRGRRRGRLAQKEVVVWHAYRGRGEGRLREGRRRLQRGQRRQGRQGDDARRPLRRLRRQDHRRGPARQGAGHLHLRPGPPRRLDRGREAPSSRSTSSSTRRRRTASSRPRWRR